MHLHPTYRDRVSNGMLQDLTDSCTMPAVVASTIFDESGLQLTVNDMKAHDCPSNESQYFTQFSFSAQAVISIRHPPWQGTEETSSSTYAFACPMEHSDSVANKTSQQK